MKITTKQLYELRESINTNGVVKADVYFDDQPLPGKVIATSRDVFGTARVLVVWCDTAAIEDIEEQQLVSSLLLQKGEASVILDGTFRCPECRCMDVHNLSCSRQ